MWRSCGGEAGRLWRVGREGLEWRRRGGPGAGDSLLPSALPAAPRWARRARSPSGGGYSGAAGPAAASGEPAGGSNSADPEEPGEAQVRGGGGALRDLGQGLGVWRPGLGEAQAEMLGPSLPGCGAGDSVISDGGREMEGV